MYTRLLGWLTFTGITVSALLFFQNMIQPKQTKKRVKTHCIIGKLTLITVTAHLLSQPISGWGTQWTIWSGLGFYMLIIASGVILLYLPDWGGIRYHARSVHPAITVGLVFTLIHHILTVYGLF